MKHKRPPVPVLIVLVLVVLAGAYIGIRALLNRSSDMLTASGTIETVEVTISPEIGGKVAEVLVEEGATVETGDELFVLDDTLLQAQRLASAAGLELAQAARTTAQVQYDLIVNSARLEAAANRTAGWRGAEPSGYTLPGWYFLRTDEITAAQAELEVSLSTRSTTQAALDGLLGETAAADFAAAEVRLLEARAAVRVALDVLTRTRAAAGNAEVQDAAQTAFNTAQAELENAQSAYDALKGSDTAQTIITARAELAVVQERCDSARDRLSALQTGENSLKVAAAASALDQAQTVVTQAEAALALLDVQIKKLTVRAPAGGVILTRSIDPGEVVAAGTTALTLGRLDSLTITVFIPEERYGELSLSQTARVSVDSFPGETFVASVVHIADEAEFTPRNVQTAEGRKSTVFAIRLQVSDPDGKLKPGMPADVVFEGEE